MKKHIKRTLSLVMAIVITVLSCPLSFAGKEIDSYYFWLSADENPTLSIDVAAYKDTHFDNTFHLFLPKGYEGETLTVSSRYALNSVVGALSVDKEAKKFVLSSAEGSSVTVNGSTLKVMHTCLPTVSINIDPGYSLDKIHADKEVKIGAHVSISGTENGKYDLASTSIEMKTRGNTTFYFNKKPYQIKFNKKTDLFGMGKAKKWILLANYIDGTGTRNKLAFDVTEKLGMKDTPKSVFVDLYIDGDYVGNYQLIEKIEVGSSRVDLKDELGIIFEMDATSRVDSSETFVRGPYSGKLYIFKDCVTDIEDVSTPEKTEQRNRVVKFGNTFIYDVFEETLYSDESTWEDVAKIIDVDSFIRYYFVNEMFEQIDCTLASTYFYIDGENDVLHCGPMWDFDRICGWQNDYDQTWNADYLKNMVENTDSQRCDIFKQLFKYPEFVKLANDFYEECAREVFKTENLTSMIDDYQSEMWQSLMANFTRWFYVFVDRTTTMDDYGYDTYENRVNYVTDLMKSWIKDRNRYLETAYGSHFPIISYSAYGAYTGSEPWHLGVKTAWQPAVTGGSMTYGAEMKGLSFSYIPTDIEGDIIFDVATGPNLTTIENGEKFISDKEITGIRVSLSGNLAHYFDVEYRVLQTRRVQNEGFKGWSSWVKNGAFAGSSSSNTSYYSLNKIQVRLVSKKSVAEGSATLKVNGEDKKVSGIIGNKIPLEEVKIPSMKFDGWYFTPDFSGTPVKNISFTSSEITLYAKYSPVPYVKGDIDIDGEITLRDVLYTRKIVAGVLSEDESELLDLERGDINEDEDITMIDVLILRKILAGIL